MVIVVMFIVVIIAVIVIAVACHHDCSLLLCVLSVLSHLLFIVDVIIAV